MPPLFNKSLGAINCEELFKFYNNINIKTNEICSKAPISLEEESMLRVFYHTKIRDICGALEFTLNVQFDAHFILHKYFLKFGIIEHDLKHIMLSCVFLATKLQNMHLTMDSFSAKIPNIQPELIVKYEVLILSALEFKPPMYSPVVCLYGFIMDLSSKFDKDFDYNVQLQRGIDRLQIALMVDKIILCETPTEIALACLYESKSDSFERYLKDNFSDTNVADTVRYIDGFISNRPTLDPESLRSIDKKIRDAKQ